MIDEKFLQESLNLRPVAHSFNQGRFIEIANNIRVPGSLEQTFGKMQQPNYIVKLPGERASGNHYHRFKNEELVLLEGDLIVALKDPSSDVRYQTTITAGNIVTLVPRIAHAILCASESPARYLEVSSSTFNPGNDKEDVYLHEVLGNKMVRFKNH